MMTAIIIIITENRKHKNHAIIIIIIFFKAEYVATAYFDSISRYADCVTRQCVANEQNENKAKVVEYSVMD